MCRPLPHPRPRCPEAADWHSNPNANPPLPGIAGGDGVADGTSQLYDVLTAWVEKGIAPSRIDISTFPVAKSRPICAYPKKATYVSGDINLATSYVCAGGS